MTLLCFVFNGAVGGIRTHGPLPVKRFRIVLVMTTSIPLQLRILSHIPEAFFYLSA